MRLRPSFVVLAGVLLLVLVMASLVTVSVAALPVVVAIAALLALLAGIRAHLPDRFAGGPTPPTGGFDEHGGASLETVPADPTDMGAPAWTVEWRTTPAVTEVPAVRERLAIVLAEWGLDRDAALPTLQVVTELFSNALQHAPGPLQLTVGIGSESVRVEVDDTNPVPPRVLPTDPVAEHGRGLRLVRALSTRWGWTNNRGGKTVWADVSIGEP
jgi:hypothetical protein